MIDRRAPRLCLVTLFGIAVDCGSVPEDAGSRLFPAGGVIRGSVVYRGPRPCSRDGHIVGNAVILVYDRRSLPPPDGPASTPVNFTDVVGDVLFANEPRYTGPQTYCPSEHGFLEMLSVSAPYQVAPLAAGSYEVRAFFDFRGDFLPSFKIRNLPEKGDIGGGAVDALPDQADPNFTPRFVPVNVGTSGVTPPLGPPSLVIPPQGFVADNVTVTIAAPFETTRPYFYAQGLTASFDPSTGNLVSTLAQSSDAPPRDTVSLDGTQEVDPNYAPVLTVPQDIEVLALPEAMTPQSVRNYESKFPRLRLQWGVPSGELAAATAAPFNMQLAPSGQTSGIGFSVWGDATLDPATHRYVPEVIPEGGVPKLWPLVVLTKLASDPTHRGDPASLAAQGSATEPVVLLQAITLLGNTDPSVSDSLFDTVASVGLLFDASGRAKVVRQDHLTALLRPTVLCFGALFDPSASDRRGTLVTTHLTGTTADVDCSSGLCAPSGTADRPLSATSLLDAPALASLVRGPPLQGCLPAGRFAINVVYPNGQAWTVPNEAGACSGSEGVTDYPSLTCTVKPRSVLYSQGNRAVVEIVAAQDPAYCLAHPVPTDCAGL